MFVEKVNDLFFVEFPLDHVFDGELSRIFDGFDDLVELLRLEYNVGFDDGDSVGKVNLLRIK